VKVYEAVDDLGTFGSEWSASRPGRFTPGTNRIEKYVFLFKSCSQSPVVPQGVCADIYMHNAEYQFLVLFRRLQLYAACFPKPTQQDNFATHPSLVYAITNKCNRLSPGVCVWLPLSRAHAKRRNFRYPLGMFKNVLKVPRMLVILSATNSTPIAGRISIKFGTVVETF
jgi:hypothetical protein